MTQKTTRIILAAALLPVLTMAQLTPKVQTQVETLCKSAIGEKGYSDYAYKYVETIKAESGNYSMTGTAS